MNVRIYNLNKFFELRRKNKFIDKFFYSDNPISEEFGLLFITVDFFALIFFIANCFIDIKISLIIFLFLIALVFMEYMILYIIDKNVFEDEMKYGVDILNTVYVNPNNENEVILLYELIKKYGFSSFTVISDYKINININTKQLEFKKFNDFKHSKPEIRKLLTEHIIPKKKLSESEALSFYNKYIEPKIEGKKLSFDEKEQTLKQLAKLNKVNL